MNPSEIAILQAQRGQATRLPGREVQIRGLGMATGPVAPVPPPPPPPGANAASTGSGIPWWAIAILGIGIVYAVQRRGQR